MKKLTFLILSFLFLTTSCQKAVVNYSNEYEEEIGQTIIIDIKGAVKFPGIYYIDNKMLLNDAIKIAGGVTNDADLSSINLASPLSNNQMIMIPYKIKGNISNLININHATVNELMTLPGIGEAKAQAIVKYRNQQGFFNQIEDLMKVPGIGQEIFNKFKTLITIS